jgi:hypothetical protein
VAVHNLRPQRRSGVRQTARPLQGVSAPLRRARAFSASVSGLFRRLRITCARACASAPVTTPRGA